MAIFKPVRVVKTVYGTYSLHYYRPDGRRKRLSAGSNRQAADRLAVKYTDWLLEGKDPENEMEQAKQDERAKAITLRQFYPIFIERYGSRQSKNQQEHYYYFFKNICRCSKLADCSIRDVSKRSMTDYMQVRMKQDGVSTATVNREAAFVRGMLYRAVEWDMLDRNPLQNLKLFKEEGKRDVNLSPEQAGALVETLPSPVDSIVEFAIYSGFRKQNILGLRIESLLFHDLRPTAEVSMVVKGGRREKLFLGQNAVEVLQRIIGSRKEGYVFLTPQGDKYKDVKDTFNRAVRKLGLTAENGSKLRFHDLRHVFATWLRNAGVSLDDLRSLLGHKDRDTTDRYASWDQKVVGEKLNLMPKIGRR